MSVGHRFRRGTEQHQDFVQEEITERDHNHTQYQCENHTVTKNILGPFLVFFAQNNGHAGSGAHPN